MNRKTSVRLQILFTVCSMLALGWGNVLAAASETVVYNFHPLAMGFQPNGPLISDAAGNLYGSTAYGGEFGLGTVFELKPKSGGGWTESVLYSFKGGSDVFAPCAGLVFDAAGNLYGGATAGGGLGLGGVFRLTPDSRGGWTESVLTSLDGYQPDGGFVFDAAGNLYGVVGLGPRSDGSVFELTPDSNGHWTKRLLHTFTGGSDGSAPNASLVARAGHLYGTTSSGGAGEGGVVFELTAGSGGSWTERVLYSFSGGGDGWAPVGGVIFDQAGNLYGTTDSGGAGCSGAGCGTVFKLTPSSDGQWVKSVLYNFGGGSDGQNPYGALSFDQAGHLYGTTSGLYSLSPRGTVFELTPQSDGQWIETVLWRFTGGADGEYPESGVLVGSAGQLYGTAISGGTAGFLHGDGTVFELTPGAGGEWQEVTITDFPFTDSGGPQSNLIADSGGNFYGTATYGGAHGYGTIYELTQSAGGAWKESILHSFTTGEAFYGSEPSSLVFDGSGNLYGETAYGGAHGVGLVFELSPSASGGWTEKNLYSFKGDRDGGNPFGGLILDQAGNLYGTTQFGGSAGCGSACGTVFELTPGVNGKWSETVLYSFAGGNDGFFPVGGVVFDRAGNLYGTTQYGGIQSFQCSPSGCGTVFKLSPATGGGWTESQLHLFTEQGGDGALPVAGLIFDETGNLYGTTAFGGTHTLDCSIGCGAVFELSPTESGGWTERTLDGFVGLDGYLPVAGVIFDAAGNLYGTTEGGFDTEGTVFELSPVSGGWNETVLHVFPFSDPGSHDGQFPEAGLILDRSGNVYGTTTDGGKSGGGMVFEITP
jgi:uncharacterized repeat protein (TIGR03803 family)